MSYNRLILRLVTCIATRVLKDVVFKERVWFFRAAAASPVEGMVKHGGNLKDIHMEALGSKNAPLWIVQKIPILAASLPTNNSHIQADGRKLKSVWYIASSVHLDKCGQGHSRLHLHFPLPMYSLVDDLLQFSLIFWISRTQAQRES